MALENAFTEILSKRSIGRAPLSGVCPYQSMYNFLPKEDQKTLDDAWARNYPVNLIVQALRADGQKCSADTIRNHRNGTCRCPKE
jgi:hypothetical protein